MVLPWVVIRPKEIQAAFERLFSCPPRAGIFTSGAFVRNVRLDLMMEVIGLITEILRLANKLLS